VEGEGADEFEDTDHGETNQDESPCDSPFGRLRAYREY